MHFRAARSRDGRDDARKCESAEQAWVQVELTAVGDGAGVGTWSMSAFTATRWVSPSPSRAEPVWALRTDDADLPPSRVDVVLALNGHGEVRIV
ncbi:hypothetical protein AB0B31_28315 [Catellatospora citrea]|uniref:hypothetical protein n=1 Tax=Catellatospora citrea TaxID=53366 RepID=UPI0033C78BFC